MSAVSPRPAVASLTMFLFYLDRQRSTLTAERIEGYSQMIQTATADFEDRLERINETLEILVNKKVAGSGSEAAEAAAAAEVHQIQEERLGTEKSLEICTKLSEHISQLRLAGRNGAGSNTAGDTDSVTERITSEGLDECEGSILRMAARLTCHEKKLFNRLASMAQGSGGSNGKNDVEIIRLKDEWESTQRQKEILSKASRKLEETVSVIQNRATGNAIQVMVSVDGKPLHGTNEATGPNIGQAGGNMSNETVQQIMQGMVKVALASYENERASRRDNAKKTKPTTKVTAKAAMAEDEGYEGEESSGDSKFEDLYGEGFTLECESPTEQNQR